MARIPVIETDLQLGGRFTTLRSFDGFEWLWSNPRTIRTAVAPGDLFVEAGGVEECFPTIAGRPDHGSVWSRPWTAIDSKSAVCRTHDALLFRSVDERDSEVIISYRVEADSGYRFVWAFHALVNPDPELAILVRTGETVLTWPDGYDMRPLRSLWPRVGTNDRFDNMRFDDGTASFALLPHRSDVEIRIGLNGLSMKLDSPNAPTSIGIWRNLAGFAWDGGEPYRSIGIEPMLGRNPSLGSQADTAIVPPSGFLEWTLTLRLS